MRDNSDRMFAQEEYMTVQHLTGKQLANKGRFVYKLLVSAYDTDHLVAHVRATCFADCWKVSNICCGTSSLLKTKHKRASGHSGWVPLDGALQAIAEHTRVLKAVVLIDQPTNTHDAYSKKRLASVQNQENGNKRGKGPTQSAGELEIPALSGSKILVHPSVWHILMMPQ